VLLFLYFCWFFLKYILLHLGCIWYGWYFKVICGTILSIILSIMQLVVWYFCISGTFSVLEYCCCIFLHFGISRIFGIWRMLRIV